MMAATNKEHASVTPPERLFGIEKEFLYFVFLRQITRCSSSKNTVCANERAIAHYI